MKTHDNLKKDKEKLLLNVHHGADVIQTFKNSIDPIEKQIDLKDFMMERNKSRHSLKEKSTVKTPC